VYEVFQSAIIFEKNHAGQSKSRLSDGKDTPQSFAQTHICFHPKTLPCPLEVSGWLPSKCFEEWDLGETAQNR